MPFIMLRYIPCIPTLVRVFIINVRWILSNAFFASFEMVCSFCLLLMWCIKHGLICTCWAVLGTLGLMQLDHRVWSFLCTIGYGLLIFCQEFCIYFHKGYWSVVFYYNDVFIWFWYEYNTCFIEWAFLFLWKGLCRIANSSWNIWWKLLVKLSGLGDVFSRVLND